MSKETNPEQAPTVGEDLPEVEQELSQVATNPKQSLLILVGISVVFIYLFFNLFISSGDSDADTTPVPDEVAKPIQIDSDSDVPSIPTLPSPPKLEDPTPPPPPDAEPLPLAEDALPALPSEPSLPTINEVSSAGPSLHFAVHKMMTPIKGWRPNENLP